MSEARRMENDDRAPRSSRRDFIATNALLGGSVLLGGAGGCAFRSSRQADGGTFDEGNPYELAKPENILYSTCLQCNTGCEIKVKLLDGVVAKIDGSPYSPRTMYPTIAHTAAPQDAARVDGVLCPKGHAGIQTLYDPYRLVKVLKRSGPRGSGQWQTVPFDQAITEIVEGGRLFSDIPGEEQREVEGLRSLWAVRDAEEMKTLSQDAAAIQAKTLSVEAFQDKHAARLDKLIDPDHPDLGPKNNQFVFTWGRLKAGRAEFFQRFVTQSFGSVNAHGHTTVCQGSLYFTCKVMTDQYRDGTWAGGEKKYWMADAEHAEFVIYLGSNPMEGNYGPPLKSQRISSRIESGQLKVAFADPRLPKGSARAWKWLPMRPGSEGALALAMIRWILEHNRHARGYLSNATRAAAKADGEPTFSNASWLVKIGDDGRPGAFARASEIGLFESENLASNNGKSSSHDSFVLLKDGQPVAFDPDGERAIEGDLFVDTELAGIRLKSSLQIIREIAFEQTMDQWAEIVGVRARDIEELAREFTVHGKRAVCEPHRGVSQHTNGFYSVLAVFTLNLLIGNMDWKGGLMRGGGTFDEKGEKGHAPFDLKKSHPGALKGFGTDLIRHGADYEKSTLFDGYPARRPWFPFSSDVYQEILPSIGTAYPYPVKLFFLYMGTPVYALPAGDRTIQVLTNLEKLPLFITSDIVVGETSMYADYIFPDLSYLERWEFQGTHPSIPQKVSPIRQPVVAPLVETVEVFGHGMPCSTEAVFLALAEKLGLPGFGPDGFGPGQPLERMEDFYLKMVANIAAGMKPGDELPDASPEETELLRHSRRHLPSMIFDEGRWQAAVGSLWWPKVVYALNRGGRFQDYQQAWDGEQLATKQGGLLNLYLEKVAAAKNSMTGQQHIGHAVHHGVIDSLGRPVDDGLQYPFQLITYREIAATKSRTIGNYWLHAILPQNGIMMNSLDARRLGLREGDWVRVQSASNPDGLWDFGNGGQKPMVGQLRVVEGIRPGVIAFPLGFGHWAYGATDIEIDGHTIRHDRRRGVGMHANAAMRVDPHLNDVTLQDLVGGSASFYDTYVQVVAVTPIRNASRSDRDTRPGA